MIYYVRNSNKKKKRALFSRCSCMDFFFFITAHNDTNTDSNLSQDVTHTHRRAGNPKRMGVIFIIHRAHNRAKP